MLKTVSKVVNRCEWPKGCDKKARFIIWKIKTGERFQVCAAHDSYIGIRNLVACGCNLQEATEINREMHQEIHHN